jgi:hypothetical protein
VKWRPIVIAGLACGAVAVLVIWLQHARLVGHWLQIHTGIVNEPGPHYGFWSGFGSDLEEFGILGAIAAAIYSLVKKSARAQVARHQTALPAGSPAHAGSFLFSHVRPLRHAANGPLMARRDQQDPGETGREAGA